MTAQIKPKVKLLSWNFAVNEMNFFLVSDWLLKMSDSFREDDGSDTVELLPIFPINYF